ncbi:MAG: FtsK/SpoIIIE domain-containing protein [Acidimicrobiia bacterium]
MELRVGAGAEAPRLDCRVALDPGATVAELREALAAHAADRGIAVPPGALLRGPDGDPLDPAARVAGEGVAPRFTSGQRLWLSEQPPPTGLRSPAPSPGEVDERGTVPFNRTPYRPVAVRPRPLPPLPAPPAPPRPSRVAVTSFVVPLATGIGFAVVLGRPQYLLIALLAPLALAAVALVERGRGRRSHRGARAEHHRQLEEALGSIDRVLAEERADRERALPPLADLAAAARSRRPELWARDLRSPDLLVLRLGTAPAPSHVSLEIDPGGDEDLRRDAERRIAEATATIDAAPVALDLDDDAVVAVVGPPGERDGLARSLLAQVAVRHGPEDVVVAALLAPSALADHEWLRWLPHARSSASPLAGPHLAGWPADVDVLLGALLDQAVDGRSGPRIVVVAHEDAAVDRGALGRLLDAAPGAGIRVLWLGADEGLVPRQCRVVVRVEADGSGERTSTDPADEPLRFSAEVASPEVADAIARDLAPLRDSSSATQASALPGAVGLADVLAADDVAEAWSRSTFESLAAPVGVAADGPMVLDLVEHGPHALVAGTSGAGKSELLQTLVAGLAATHPPEHVTFLFVDYKGGAAAAPFADLPHTVGSVTNLDAAASRRALTSLRAELDRRMALLAEEGDGAADLATLALTRPDRCPPRLVIVVDELATLAKEIPDFVPGIVDIAQRGRSLGIHLVLATQRPAGVVTESIRANVNLRIALRVLDASDSQNVIGAADAAAIPVPRRGRAIARLGPTELVPFQAAWSGAARAGAGRARVRVEPLAFDGAGATGDAADPGEGTQLDEVLAAVADAHRRTGGAPPRRPWLPPLPGHVRLEPLLDLVADERRADPGRWAVLGLHDDPAHQAQRLAVVDLEAEGGLAVFGAGGAGRTTALRTAVASLVSGASPGEVQVVALDFAGRTLRSLLDLPHTAAVRTSDDLDATAREIDHLSAEVDRRRTVLAGRAADSLSALRALDPAAAADLPRIALVVDGFAGLRADLDTPAGYEWWQRLQRVLVDGRQVGIHALVTADRRADLPAPLLTAIGARLVLRMTEPEAMSSLGVPLTVARGAELPPGRGFLRGDEEVQVAVLGDDASAAGQARALADLGRRASGEPAARRDPLPDEVDRPAGLDRDLEVAIGVGDDGPVTVDLRGGHLLVVGPPASGRTTALAAVAAGLAAAGAPCTRIDGRADDALERLEALVRDAVPGADRHRPHVVLVDDADELGDGPGGRLLEQLAGAPGVRLVAVADAAAVARAFSGWVPAVRRGRRALVLQPASSADVDQVAGVRVRLRPGARFPVGRGVLVEDRRPHVVQVARTS